MLWLLAPDTTTASVHSEEDSQLNFRVNQHFSLTMKSVAFVAFLASVEAFLVPPAKPTTTVLANALEGFNDVFGEQGKGNLIQKQDVFQVQGGSLVDWSATPAIPCQDGPREGAALPQLYDVIGQQGLVMTQKQDDITVQGGSLIDWNDKEFLNNH